MPGTKLEDLLADQQAHYHTWSSSDFTIPLCTTLISDPVDIPLCKILEGNEPPKGVLIGAPLYLPPHINTNTEDSRGNSLIALFHNKAITCGFSLKSRSHSWNFVHVSCTRDRLYNGGKKSSTNSGKKCFTCCSKTKQWLCPFNFLVKFNLSVQRWVMICGKTK
eukprot:scaffold376_cov156-Amphora_coffeaeformis.AAC.19